MIEKSCRCGANKKRFHRDIGPFYVEECCKEAGYDDLGNKSKETRVEQYGDPKPASTSILQKFLGVKKPGRGKLMDMKVEELKELAKTKNIELQDGLNKKQIVELLLK